MRKTALYMCGIVTIWACHARPNDPAGQAKELSDPVRRENAIVNLTRLYTEALSRAKGDRSQAAVKSIVDVSIDALSGAVVSNPDDHSNALKILDLLLDMRDKRAFKAWIPSLNWRQEVTEEHAIRAAKGLASVADQKFSDAEISTAVAALKASLSRVMGSKPVENRLRVECIQALGALKSPAAADALAEVVRRQSASQNFLINRLALEQLAMMRDVRAVPTLVMGLFLFDANNPANRMNDVAVLGLAMVPKAAAPEVLALLNGTSTPTTEAVKNTVGAYIRAVKARSPDAAAGMDISSVMTAEATYALGQMGIVEAVPALLKRADAPQSKTRLAAILALASMPLSVAHRADFRAAFTKVYGKSEKTQRPQLLAAAQHVFDQEMLPMFLSQAGPGEEEFPMIRVSAARAAAALATKSGAQALKNIISAEPGSDEGGFRKTFEENNPAIETAFTCDTNIACYRAKLSDSRLPVVRKAAAMMAVLVTEPTVDDMSALTKALQRDDEVTRADVLYAIDRISHKARGSKALLSMAQEAIQQLQTREQGRASWTRLRGLALTTLGHLDAR